MKCIFILLLALTLTLSCFTGCGEKDSGAETDKSQNDISSNAPSVSENASSTPSDELSGEPSNGEASDGDDGDTDVSADGSVDASDNTSADGSGNATQEELTEEQIEVFEDMFNASKVTWLNCNDVVFATQTSAAILDRFVLCGERGGLEDVFGYDPEYVKTDPRDELFDMGADKYDAEGLDWLMENIYGVALDRDNVKEGYFEDGYYYRSAWWMGMGAPEYVIGDYEAQYELLDTGEYKITVTATAQPQYDIDGTEAPYEEVYEFIATPEYDEEHGIYWQFISFKNITE